jgi:hypothetical protein
MVVVGRQQLWYHLGMKSREFLQVDPASLHLPGSRMDGADPMKLQRQVAKHGTSTEGMPPLDVKRGTDGEFVIYDGVTRATRLAKYLPGTPITVEVTGELTRPVGGLPKVGDKL